MQPSTRLDENRPRMDLSPITLTSWPTCADCLSWSSDGDIAVAGGEFVHILTPKRKFSTPIPTTGTVGHPDWNVTTVRINLFSQGEWPDQDMQSHSDFSIGEEQSWPTVTALEWSPPGLGLHRRSVLAMLTSNLVLCLWQTDGTLSKWDRAFVINHALERHFFQLGNDDGPPKRKKRIRSFCWTPPLRDMN